MTNNVLELCINYGFLMVVLPCLTFVMYESPISLRVYHIYGGCGGCVCVAIHCTVHGVRLVSQCCVFSLSHSVLCVPFCPLIP